MSNGGIELKKVLITGGNGDIARAIQNKLLCSEEFEVQTPGKNELDVTDIAGVKEYIEGYVPDILINNAGYVLPQSIAECDLKSTRTSIDVNLFGTFNCAAAVLRKNVNAVIINIGSSAATKVHGTWSSYCAAKAGVVMATQCWAEDGIKAVCISPGRTATKMRKGLYPDEDVNTLLKPDDLAQIVMYAVNGKYKWGSHINVTLQNIGALLND